MPPQAVKLVRPLRREVHRTVELPAEARPWREARLHAKVSGLLKEVTVDIGDRVREGQLLARLEVPESARQVEAARAEAARAEQQQQALQLQARALQQQSQAGQSRSQALGAQSQAVGLEGEARSQDQLMAQDWLAYSEIRAPFAGVISRRHLHPGALVQSSAGSAQGATQPFLELVDDRRLRVTTQVPESEAPWVRPDQLAWVRADAFPEEVFSGKVSRVAGVIGSDRCMQAEVELDNPERRLRAGMFVRLTLSLQVHSGVLALPSHSVLEEKGKYSVFLAEGGKARKLPVQVGFRNRDWTEIREGLKGDEEVVDEGRERLVDGTPLEVRP